MIKTTTIVPSKANTIDATKAVFIAEQEILEEIGDSDDVVEFTSDIVTDSYYADDDLELDDMLQDYGY